MSPAESTVAEYSALRPRTSPNIRYSVFGQITIGGISSPKCEKMRKNVYLIDSNQNCESQRFEVLSQLLMTSGTSKS